MKAESMFCSYNIMNNMADKEFCYKMNNSQNENCYKYCFKTPNGTEYICFKNGKLGSLI